MYFIKKKKEKKKESIQKLPGVSTLLYNTSTPHSREGEYFFTYTVHMWPFYMLDITFCPTNTLKSMWTM